MQITVTLAQLAAQGIDELRAIRADIVSQPADHLATVENFGETADECPRVVVESGERIVRWGGHRLEQQVVESEPLTARDAVAEIDAIIVEMEAEMEA